MFFQNIKEQLKRRDDAKKIVEVGANMAIENACNSLIIFI